MAQSSTGKFIADMPSWAKGVIGIGALGAAYLVYRGISKKLDPANQTSSGGVPKSNVPATLSTDITTSAKTAPLSYKLSQYDEWASGLHTAMYSYGTDEQAIYRIMGYMKNNTDVLQLIKAFGIRKENTIGISGEGTLTEWLTNELDSTEIGIVNSTLASKKNPSITIRF